MAPIFQEAVVNMQHPRLGYQRELIFNFKGSCYSKSRYCRKSHHKGAPNRPSPTVLDNNFANFAFSTRLIISRTVNPTLPVSKAISSLQHTRSYVKASWLLLSLSRSMLNRLNFISIRFLDESLRSLIHIMHTVRCKPCLDHLSRAIKMDYLLMELSSHKVVGKRLNTCSGEEVYMLSNQDDTARATLVETMESYRFFKFGGCRACVLAVPYVYSLGSRQVHILHRIRTQWENRDFRRSSCPIKVAERHCRRGQSLDPALTMPETCGRVVISLHPILESPDRTTRELALFLSTPPLLPSSNAFV